MARKRTLLEPPHEAIRRAIDAHAAIGAPPVEPELQAAEDELARQQQERRPARSQRRGAGGRFA